MAGTALFVFISAHTMLSLFLLYTSLATATATDSLTINQTLTFNKTLISSNQNFELGFFTPANSNDNRWYLGIWFKKIPIRTYVWIANRDHPLHSSSSPALKINNNGHLTLVNQTRHVIWSSSSSSSSMMMNTSNRAHTPVFALLLDNGNLVVKSQTSTDDDVDDGSNGYVWQSFDYPSENLISGMKFGWNLKTGLNRNLRSWKSSDDPSNGDFVYEMDRRGFPELVFRKGSVNLYRTGPWTGIQFSGTPELKNNPVFEPIFVHTDEEVYYSFRSTGSVVSILRLDPSGSLNRIAWNDRILQWVVMLSVMKDQCNEYGLCGVHGVCNIDDTVPCKCLKGFVPTSPQNWSRVDWSDGCRRRTSLNCSNGVGDDGFQKLSFAKVPDTTFAWVNMSMSLNECQMKCFKNCSCTAFANADVRGSGSGCVLWFGDLIDLREFTAGGGQDLYVRMAASELEAQQGGSKKKKKRAAVVARVSVVTGILLVASIVWCFIVRTRKRQRGEGRINQEEDSTRELELPLFDFVTVANATNNFSNDKVIGEGGFGPVYKGILPNGQEIAVKRLSENSGQGLREFKNEVILISKLQHRNLVKVLGCCIQREEMIGYMSPEYAADGLFSMKSDVFSFGVLTLEIVSGKRNKGFYLAGHDFNLLGHAWNLWNDDRAMELVDEVFTVEVSSRFAVLRCIQVGLLCVQQRLDDRPTMPSVVMMLGSDGANLPQPKQPVQTIVWVANRDHPLHSSSSGALTINNNGHLILINQTNNVIIWSSNSSSSIDNPIAQLLETGNLIIKSKTEETEQPSSSSSSRRFIWQSFDHPTDTTLNGMRIGWDFKTGFAWKLQSWKNLGDPSMGDFVYEMDPHGFPELVLRNGSMKLFRPGPWNGIQFSGTPELKNNSIFEPLFVSNDEEVYFTVKTNDNSVITRLVLDPSGYIYRYTWNARSLQWVLMINVLKDQCNKYGLCGVHGVCNIDEAVLCKCLKGFVPNAPADWNRVDWSGGCRRRTGLDCGKGDGFLKFSSLKVPDTTFCWVNKSMGLGECQMKCLMNCSCTAYADSDIRGSGSGCVLWFGDLIDIREFTAGGGQDLYVRMAASELEVVNGGGTNKKEKLVAVIASTSVVVAVLLAALTIWCFVKRTRMRRKGEENIILMEGSASKGESDLELPLFDFVTVATATNNFSHDNVIGEGGFGPVYKGKLSSGQEIAVKRLSKNSGQGVSEFKNEIVLIAKLQHRNLVRLLGCCIQREEMILIYEYMPNESLDYFIFDQARSKLLGWQKRFDIIVGIAQGLLYLHRDSILRIIHRDLKVSNVLLDREMNPKISDFGLARIYGGDEKEVNTRRVVGTYGYMSPEYAAEGLFSIKSDVFSFGVLVLEIVSGKRNKGFQHSDHDLNLLGHVWNLWNEDKASELIDATIFIKDELSRLELLRCIQVGLLCVQQRPDDRPTMSSVVIMLSSDSPNLPQPKHPGFYYQRSFSEGPSSSNIISYEKNVSFTTLEGR
ncbi:hypothetical protein Scep_013210 [Stephania cephalantha]|uniref:non-specific serine/threonine protein kinase n=1 Tax=Stephania cephalantha TaxID=152367 RepID=A0AAP0JIW2_9MAGN